MSDRPITITIRRRWLRLFLVVAVTAGVVAPVSVIAADRFTDVPTTNTFHADINAIADAGVTIGCNPPANTEYCPKDNVTREQMAAFMNRLGALGPGKTPVVNAATAQTAENATNADTLDGYDSADLAPRFILTDQGFGGVLDDVTSGTEVCVSAEYTPDSDEVAVIDARVSSRHDSASGDLWLRTAVSTDGGTNWTNTSGRVSPEEVVSTTDDHAVSYADVYPLDAGTTYNFAVEINGSTHDDVRCQVMVTIHERFSASILGAVAGSGGDSGN